MPPERSRDGRRRRPLWFLCGSIPCVFRCCYSDRSPGKNNFVSSSMVSENVGVWVTRARWATAFANKMTKLCILGLAVAAGQCAARRFVKSSSIMVSSSPSRGETCGRYSRLRNGNHHRRKPEPVPVRRPGLPDRQCCHSVRADASVRRSADITRKQQNKRI